MRIVLSMRNFHSRRNEFFLLKTFQNLCFLDTKTLTFYVQISAFNDNFKYFFLHVLANNLSQHFSNISAVLNASPHQKKKKAKEKRNLTKPTILLYSARLEHSDFVRSSLWVSFGPSVFVFPYTLPYHITPPTSTLYQSRPDQGTWTNRRRRGKTWKLNKWLLLVLLPSISSQQQCLLQGFLLA